MHQLFFLFLGSIFHVIICLSIYQLMAIWIISGLGLWWVRLLWTFLCQSLCGNWGFHSSYLERELLSQTNVFSAVEKTAKLRFRVLVTVWILYHNSFSDVVTVLVAVSGTSLRILKLLFNYADSFFVCLHGTLLCGQTVEIKILLLLP